MAQVAVAAPNRPQSSAKTKLALNPFTLNLLAGGGAGMVEALVCHPLDTVKVKMQLTRSTPGHRAGLVDTAAGILRSEGPLSFYKGLSSVLAFIGPKYATRFAAFEGYKKFLSDANGGKLSSGALFSAAVGAGLTEAVVVVTPMEVVKIRLQSQQHMAVPRYRNAAHAVYVVLQESGIKGLYSGLGLTAARQASNQAASLSTYSHLKGKLEAHHGGLSEVPTWQMMGAGLIAGAAGPCTNTPIDTLKTHLQRTPLQAGQSSMSRLQSITVEMIRQEGTRALYKGLLPRVLRIGPGQAVSYPVYEMIKARLSNN